MSISVEEYFSESGLKILLKQSLKNQNETQIKDILKQWEIHFLPHADLQKSAPQLVLFFGDVGAGKTTFLRYWAESLGFKVVQSPTYAFHNRYISSQENQTFDHFDLYRAETEEEIESIGFWDLLSESKKWSVVEWAENVDSSSWKGLSNFTKIWALEIKVSADSRDYSLYQVGD